MMKWIALFCLLVTGFGSARASHIVGGEFRFINLSSEVGPDSVRYRIVFTLYMDCENPNPGAIQDEDVSSFYIFKGNGQPITGLEKYTIPKLSTKLLPADFSNSCVSNPPTTCLLRNIYEFTISLPNEPTGYVLLKSDCCRNASVVNVVDPSNVGSSYSIELPPRSVINNSAVYRNLPPQIICINVPFEYDHSAVDPDGDSLSYRFGPAFNGDNVSTPAPPPFQPILYMGGFTFGKPLAGAPIISINSKTGVIKGTPNLTGRFVVAVYCSEWRNGVIINTVIREYQFVVTNCSKLVDAEIPQYSEEYNTYIVQCESLEVKFDNLSTGGFKYDWDFGVPGILTDVSSDFSPTFTYPDTGTYVVSLVVNKGSTCTDSTTRLVKVYPTFKTAFTFDDDPCPGISIQFTDSSFSSNPSYTAISWFWNFGDSITSTEPNPAHTFPEGGKYQVSLTSSNGKGCIDTAVNQVTVELFRPFAGNDTIIVQGESINFSATGGGTYLWTPDIYLNNNAIANPVGFYPDTGRFTYVVDITSPFNCMGSDTISVWVVSQGALFVPTAFSPNGDGVNDVLRPIGIGYSNIRYFRIFNRWGEQVFYTTQFNEGWNGIWKGKQADVGTYFWVLSVIDRFGKEEVVKGDVALLR
ncbi:MAG: PKD domain-containing protein [Sphingobacteriales bacterium]|nr:MAG: PKD domain-containing protein [Sphingobacteriales bacterium]